MTAGSCSFHLRVADGRDQLSCLGPRGTPTMRAPNVRAPPPTVRDSNETDVGKKAKKNIDFRSVSRYISETTENRHSYNERLIGTYIRAFDWYRFRWPWMTSNGRNATIHQISLLSKLAVYEWMKIDIQLWSSDMIPPRRRVCSRFHRSTDRV